MIHNYKVITCDSCGTERLIKDTEANRARLEAVRSGWKSHTYAGLVLRGGRTVARLWDLCETCDYPDFDTVLAKIQAEEDAGTRKKSQRHP